MIDSWTLRKNSSSLSESYSGGKRRGSFMPGVYAYGESSSNSPSLSSSAASFKSRSSITEELLSRFSGTYSSIALDCLDEMDLCDALDLLDACDFLDASLSLFSGLAGEFFALILCLLTSFALIERLCISAALSDISDSPLCKADSFFSPCEAEFWHVSLFLLLACDA